ncbi:hypothetical protein AB6A40_004157 [Gnathostoma spinigerum]|uniref:Pyrroline-5-carboxylate reductase n=1 Tax=Gnathostoma spinigerum TaxID=75299 RepID=A0ABD6EBU6_9BILA
MQPSAHFSNLCEKSEISTHTIAFIGGGQMTKAIVNGLLKSGCISKDQIAISVATSASMKRWKQDGFENCFADNSELLKAFGEGIIVLALKPQMRKQLYSSISSESLNKAGLVISIMAGINLKALEEELAEKGYTVGVARMMPNLPASVGAGASVLSVSGNLTDSKKGLVKFIGNQFGICMEVDEISFNAAAAIAGCTPAFVFSMIDAIADGGVLGGVNRSTALKLAAQTILGASKMVLDTGVHPGILKDDVCSPAGTTIFGLRVLEERGMRTAFIEAISASTKRSMEL